MSPTPERLAQLRASLRARGYQLVDDMVDRFLEQLVALGTRVRRAPLPPAPVAPVDDHAADAARDALAQAGMKRTG